MKEVEAEDFVVVLRVVVEVALVLVWEEVRRVEEAEEKAALALVVVQMGKTHLREAAR